VAKRVYIAVEDNSARARQEVNDGLADVYGQFGLNLGPVAVAGTPEECVAGVRDVVAAGAELVVLNPLRRVHEQMERLAADVIPHV
jgi:alkanesulfonate monooxygenase SsuD/methylene tetrahydromethanopterin reductase-like flavin-dependent oxidoreductase (luciferase family)